MRQLVLVLGIAACHDTQQSPPTSRADITTEDERAREHVLQQIDQADERADHRRIRHRNRVAAEQIAKIEAAFGLASPRIGAGQDEATAIEAAIEANIREAQAGSAEAAIDAEDVSVVVEQAREERRCREHPHRKGCHEPTRRASP